MKDLQFKCNSKATEPVYTSIFSSTSFVKPDISGLNLQDSIAIDKSNDLSQSYKYLISSQNVILNNIEY
jgi:hypothetical protein